MPYPCNLDPDRDRNRDAFPAPLRASIPRVKNTPDS